MIDRDQIRRDAQTQIRALEGEDSWSSFSTDLARHCLALLAELEQAERERDEARAAVAAYDGKDWQGHDLGPAWWSRHEVEKVMLALGVDADQRERAFGILDQSVRLREAEAQLAKVPALVEALTQAEIRLSGRAGHFTLDSTRRLIAEALAAWESLDAEGAPLQVPPESRRLDRAMLNPDEHTR